MSIPEHNRKSHLQTLPQGENLLEKFSEILIDDTTTSHTMADKFIQAKIDLEIILGYNFEDNDILREALWAAGPGSAGQRKFLEGNKMLALVGDTAMKTVLLHHSYTKGRMRGWSTRSHFQYRR